LGITINGQEILSYYKTRWAMSGCVGDPMTAI
jgi:hypothetical protein